MKNKTIFGKGNMGANIGKRFEDAGHKVTLLGSNDSVDTLGDIVVLTVPYDAVNSILGTYKEALKGKVLVDITNPVNFGTMDTLVVDTSSAEVIAEKVKDARVVKAFNTNFAASLDSKKVSDTVDTVVMVASDDEEAKTLLTQSLNGSGLDVVDAGALKRARQLETLGFLQITLAIREEISWTGGFAVLK